VAIIMDGNGRWARQRRLPRVAGHRKGADAVNETLRGCLEHGIEYLTLFAFSSENWRRPAEEVSSLLELFVAALEREVDWLRQHGIRFRAVGDVSRFDARLRELMAAAQARTVDGERLQLAVAVDYGGRWDIVQAMNRLLAERGATGGPYTEADLAQYLALAHAPEPDLFIRTGGEQRISNFLLWQLAYTELYFTEVLWPDFGARELELALHAFRSRERRFGLTGEQVRSAPGRQPLLAAGSSG
jgi:undecaprenyl diphosphate synthase